MARCLLDTRLELVIGLAKRRDPVAGYDSRCPACFPALLAPNRDREIGGGRATRQPGQVRKEAALTRSGSGRSSVSYLFFRANRAKCGCPRALRLILAPARIPQKWEPVLRLEYAQASNRSRPRDNQLRIDR